MKKNTKGFTLAELLIVVAIIAVLVAISIPVFTSQLHKARVAAGWANVRAYYAELQYEFMETGKIDESKLHDIGASHIGLTSFSISGQTITLQEGSIWIRKEAGDTKGYNIIYECSKYNPKCELILPTN